MCSKIVKITIILLILFLFIIPIGSIGYKDVTPSTDYVDVMGGNPQFVGNVTVVLSAEANADGPPVTTCILYGTRIIPISGFLPYGFDEKTFVIPKITADNQYHYISTWILNNPGVIYDKIEIRFIGEMPLPTYNETIDQIQQLKIGEEPDTDDISIKIFINENSTEKKNHITLSGDIFGKRFPMDELVTPGGSATLYFYVKSYNKTFSGTFQSHFQAQIFALGTTPEVTPIYNLDFELIDIKANDFTFDLDFTLRLTPDVKIGDIEVSYPNNDMWEPLPFSSISQQKNIYHLENIRLKSHGNSIEYPFDKYEEIIELNAINEANTKYINDSLKSCTDPITFTTTDWHITISVKGNCLYFTFTRNLAITVFWVLIAIGIILIGLRLGYIFRIRRSKKKRLMNFIFYLGEVISVPYCIGAIFNYIVYISPQFHPLSITSLMFLSFLILPIILGAYIFVIREEEKEKTITKLWKKRVKR